MEDVTEHDSAVEELNTEIISIAASKMLMTVWNTLIAAGVEKEKIPVLTTDIIDAVRKASAPDVTMEDISRIAFRQVQSHS